MRGEIQVVTGKNHSLEGKAATQLIQSDEGQRTAFNASGRKDSTVAPCCKTKAEHQSKLVAQLSKKIYTKD